METEALVVHGTRRRIVALALAFVFVVASAVFVRMAEPADAHGTATVKLCVRDSNNTWDSACSPAVFAACIPGFLTCTALANGPRDVDVKINGFNGNSTVYVWWLNGAAATDTNRYDCGKSSDDLTGVTTRTLLATVTTNSSGQVEFNETLPRPTWTVGPGVNQWSYGPNWVCATDVNHGQSGIVGDRQFFIYPTPL